MQGGRRHWGGRNLILALPCHQETSFHLPKGQPVRPLPRRLPQRPGIWPIAMDQPTRHYSGPGTATAATYALVAATAALAALVGVVSALWLRQRQWDAATPPSSESSGSLIDANGERHGGEAHDDEREEG